MLNLKAVIRQLHEDDFAILENQLIQSKAGNFLFLFREYKKNILDDEEIIEQLNASVASFNTLKSRLYDRIQIYLIENSSGNKSDILSQLANIPKYCYETPRETAHAILLKLEKDLKTHDMSSDLISVYSALKKIHLHTQKFYEYSQLYNKHLAYTVALEKAEDLLGSFIVNLSNYYLSRSVKILEMLNIIKNGIQNIYRLNQSPNIEVIQNICLIHLQLFTYQKMENEEATDDLLERTEKIVYKFRNNIAYKGYGMIVKFLKYEYYTQINEHKKAKLFFEEVNSSLKNWLLLDNVCLNYYFLYSKIYQKCKDNSFEKDNTENEELVFDVKNTHTHINVQFYNAINKFYEGKYKDVTSIINGLLNSTSFKDMLHFEIDVKLFLSYVYIKQNESDLASLLIRSVYRKINAQSAASYKNAMIFSKILGLLIDFNGSDQMKSKIQKQLISFEFENSGERRILNFLEFEIEKLKVTFQ